MSDYRLYFLDGANHIDRATPVEASTDRDAIDLADHLSAGRPWELWCGKRTVAQGGEAERRQA
jgi:hypothetical protein